MVRLLPGRSPRCAAAADALSQHDTESKTCYAELRPRRLRPARPVDRAHLGAVHPAGQYVGPRPIDEVFAPRPCSPRRSTDPQVPSAVAGSRCPCGATPPQDAVLPWLSEAIHSPADVRSRSVAPIPRPRFGPGWCAPVTGALARARAGRGAGARPVAPVGVAGPALVAAGVDGRRVGRHGVERVAAGVVDPQVTVEPLSVGRPGDHRVARPGARERSSRVERPETGGRRVDPRAVRRPRRVPGVHRLRAQCVSSSVGAHALTVAAPGVMFSRKICSPVLAAHRREDAGHQHRLPVRADRHVVDPGAQRLRTRGTGSCPRWPGCRTRRRHR